MEAEGAFIVHFFPYQFSSLESKVLFLSLYTPYPTPKGFCLPSAA